MKTARTITLKENEILTINTVRNGKIVKMMILPNDEYGDEQVVIQELDKELVSFSSTSKDIRMMDVETKPAKEVKAKEVKAKAAKTDYNDCVYYDNLTDAKEADNDYDDCVYYDNLTDAKKGYQAD
jgi:hypothetical protein